MFTNKKPRPEIFNEKDLVIDILSSSFKENKSVNLVVGGDKDKIPALMSYSYEMAKSNGKIFISEDRRAVALILFPKLKKFSFKTLYEDLKLAINIIGLRRVPTILKRESLIKKYHPKKPFIHLWYIGVNPDESGKGHGGLLLERIIEFAEDTRQDIYLETSTERNINFYKNHGFENFANIDSGLSFRLMLFRRTAKPTI
tara:strand:- start:2998 stop:3597 length:600 start_codon:yes stop_codon:yes gene_type:complete